MKIRRPFNISLFAAATLAALPAQAETKLLFKVFLPQGHLLQQVTRDRAADVDKAMITEYRTLYASLAKP